MGCDLDLCMNTWKTEVSIHAPAWGATRTSTTSKSMRPFQSTHPHGVRHNLTVCKTAHPLFQSTHPHGVRPAYGTFMHAQFEVSIHAPARGATYPTCICNPFHYRFNPRTRTGCDIKLAFELATTGVSIHAPARGATLNLQSIDFVNSVSIHAPARGATQATRARIMSNMFQSTHPHGVRLPESDIRPKFIDSFNPRTRTGCDDLDWETYRSREVSIHAPARGATLLTFKIQNYD